MSLPRCFEKLKLDDAVLSLESESNHRQKVTNLSPSICLVFGFLHNWCHRTQHHPHRLPVSQHGCRFKLGKFASNFHFHHVYHKHKFHAFDDLNDSHISLFSKSENCQIKQDQVRKNSHSLVVVLDILFYFEHLVALLPNQIPLHRLAQVFSDLPLHLLAA